MKSHELLMEAVTTHRRIEFTYQSNTEEAPSKRVVEPWIYGDRNSKPALFGFQVEGGSGKEPRRFNVDKIHGLRVLDHRSENHPSQNANITKWDAIHAEW